MSAARTSPFKVGERVSLDHTGTVHRVKITRIGLEIVRTWCGVRADWRSARRKRKAVSCLLCLAEEK